MLPKGAENIPFHEPEVQWEEEAPCKRNEAKKNERFSEDENRHH